MKLPPEMVKLAQHIIRTKSGEFDPSLLEDHYRNALVRIRRNILPVAPRTERAILTAATYVRKAFLLAVAQT
jgi:non-homologous end joining protein Ku